MNQRQNNIPAERGSFCQKGVFRQKQFLSVLSVLRQKQSFLMCSLSAFGRKTKILFRSTTTYDLICQFVNYSPLRRRRSSGAGRTAGRTGCCTPPPAETAPRAGPAQQSMRGKGVYTHMTSIQRGFKIV